MGLFNAASRFLRGVRRGLSQFMQELGEDIQGPRPLAPAPPPPVSEARRVAIVQVFQRDYEERAHVLVDRLVANDITLNTWLSLMATEVRTLHTSAAVAGVGGFGNLQPADLRRIEVATQTQLAYLRAWGRQLATTEDYDERQMKVRASLYGGASNETFSKAQVGSLGVPDLPFYPAENTECRTNCGCAWDIQPLEGDGNFDCYWRRGKNDSCKTCIARERKASPLRVRGGVITERPTGRDLIAARSAHGLVDILWEAGQKQGVLP